MITHLINNIGDVKTICGIDTIKMYIKGDTLTVQGRLSVKPITCRKCKDIIANRYEDALKFQI